MDEMKFVNMLVKAGKTEKESKEFVSKAVKRIKSAMPNAADETLESILMLKLDDILHGTSGDPHTGVFIGCDKMEDSNRYDKDQALEAYRTDSNQAIMKGLVRKEDDGTITPLDSRKFLDKAETKKNSNFGKPLGTRMQRQVIVIEDGNIIRGFGKVDPTLGKAYDFKASVSAGGYFNIGKDSLRECKESPNATELWDLVYNAAGSSEYVTALCDVIQAKKNAFILTKGLVKHTAETSNGGAMIVLIDGDCEDGVVGFSGSDEVKEIINHEIVVGQEVIVCGRVTENKEGKKNLVTFGVIPNPASSDISSGLNSLADLSI